LVTITVRREENQMSKKTGSKCEVTTPKSATLASKVLLNPNSSKVAKSLAGALLNQAPNQSKSSGKKK